MISVIITCAGNGTRFGENKLLVKLSNKPVVIHTVEKFLMSKNVDEVIVAVKRGYKKEFTKLFKKHNLKVNLVVGGKKRFISAFNGLKKSSGDFILVHDGARPLVPLWLIEKVISEVQIYKAVMAACEPHTCVKQTKNGFVMDNLSRKQTWLGQTPHAFSKGILREAYQNGIEKNLDGMDDCDLVSQIGVKVKIVRGEYSNLKITKPIDLVVAQHFLNREEKKIYV